MKVYLLVKYEQAGYEGITVEAVYSEENKQLAEERTEALNKLVQRQRKPSDTISLVDYYELEEHTVDSEV